MISSEGSELPMWSGLEFKSRHNTTNPLRMARKRGQFSPVDIAKKGSVLSC